MTDTPTEFVPGAYDENVNDPTEPPNVDHNNEDADEGNDPTEPPNTDHDNEDADNAS